MRIHTNLDFGDLVDAARHAGVTIARSSKHGSRSRAHAFEVNLSGSGRHGGQWGNGQGRSATWDEWGIFLAELFRRDPELNVGKVYPNEEAFHWVTVDRYRTLTPAGQHIQHKWSHDVQRAATGGYLIHTCKCGASLRSPAHGYTVADFVEVG